jgi:hypothetical protein
MRKICKNIVLFLFIGSITSIGASASTNLTVSEQLNQISNLSINFVEPSSEYIDNYESEISRVADTVIISLRFKEKLEVNPEFAFSIYRSTLKRLKEISSTYYLKNKEALELLMYETLKNSSSDKLEIALSEIETIESICLCAGEGSCGDDGESKSCSPDKNNGLASAIGLGGLAFAFQSEDAKMYAGVTSAYDSTLADTWAAREEFDAVNAARVEANQSDMEYNWTGGLLDVVSGNPYEQMNVHKAYGYGLSGDGVMVAVTDDGLCYDADDEDQIHQDLKGVGKVTTFGAFTESEFVSGGRGGQHGCHVATTVLGNYDDNSNSSAIQTEIAGHYDNNNGNISTYDPEYTMMGVAYNSTLHFSDFELSQANQELAIEDAKAKGAKVWTNSWGWNGDRTTDQVLAQSGDNNYAKYANWGNNTFSLGYTEASVTNYFDAINEFQETGVVLWAISNTTTGQSTVYGGASNQADLMASFPTLFPELSEAFISVRHGGSPC